MNPKLPPITIDFSANTPEEWRLGALIARGEARLAGILAYMPSPDRLKSFLEEAGRLGVRLVRLEVDYTAPRGPRILGVAEGTEGVEDPADRLLRAAEKAGLRNIAVLREVYRGLWINTVGFPLIAGSERIIGLRAAQFAGMASRLKARMGLLADTLYYHEGRLYGEESANLYRRVVQEGSPEDYVRAFLAGIQALGRARIIKVESTPRGYVFTLDDVWDAEGIECSHTRGVLEGYMSTILGVRFSSKASIKGKRCIVELQAL